MKQRRKKRRISGSLGDLFVCFKKGPTGSRPCRNLGEKHSKQRKQHVQRLWGSECAHDGEGKQVRQLGRGAEEWGRGVAGGACRAWRVAVKSLGFTLRKTGTVERFKQRNGSIWLGCYQGHSSYGVRSVREGPREAPFPVCGPRQAT